MLCVHVYDVLHLCMHSRPKYYTHTYVHTCTQCTCRYTHVYCLIESSDAHLSEVPVRADDRDVGGVTEEVGGVKVTSLNSH